MAPKRLIVACDGTWVNSDNGFVRESWLPWGKKGGYLAQPSNITRICRALRPQSKDGIAQVVYYQAGLGSRNDWYSYVFGGYLGDGIAENIREAYAFLCQNYEDGDEITLIGFSRGAFTARCIGAMVADIGLLTEEGLENFYSIFRDWQNQDLPGYKPEFGSKIWPTSRPPFNSPTYMPKLIEAGLTRRTIPVKAVGVFDTVGVLGVPQIQILGVTLYNQAHKQYSFVDSVVPTNVEYAYQALALDENRKPYSPTLWESPKPDTPSSLKLLKQCWFPGVHVSIGGGWSEDTSISDLTLAWMITNLSEHLAFDPDYILRQQKQNVAYYQTADIPLATWAMGAIPRSDGGLLNKILGKKTRTPGNYHATDPQTGKETNRRLVNTHEFVHPSVHYRIANKGAPLVTAGKAAPHGTYNPPALSGWTFLPPGESPGGAVLDQEGAGDWSSYHKWALKKSIGNTTVLVEEKIQPQTEEMALLDAWGSEVAAKVLAG